METPLFTIDINPIAMKRQTILPIAISLLCSIAIFAQYESMHRPNDGSAQQKVQRIATKLKELISLTPAQKDSTVRFEHSEESQKLN